MIIGRMEGNHNPQVLYAEDVNEMAAALGELELRASLIAHVLPSLLASMFRNDGAVKFLAGSTSASSQQEEHILTWAWYSEV